MPSVIASAYRVLRGTVQLVTYLVEGQPSVAAVSAEGSSAHTLSQTYHLRKSSLHFVFCSTVVVSSENREEGS